MARLDLDDLPPKIAALIEGLEAGDELVVVKGGLVVRRLEALAAPVPEPPPPEQDVAEVFETFRSAIEDEF
ncbi:MAG: hypothetical protein ACK53I_17345 [Phenylobacterium sp.]